MSQAIIRREQCPICLDTGKDNIAVYEDGGKWCFSCNEGGKGWAITGKHMPVQSRLITIDTCTFFDSKVGQYTGYIGKRNVNKEWVRIYNYYDEGKLINQKIRTANKEFKWTNTNNTEKIPLYGQWKWSPNDKLFVTIVEGEEDEHIVAQVQGYQFPVVSVPNGAGGARKSLEQNLHWLLGFKYVVLAFDSDSAGQAAVNECLPLFEPGRVRVATWPLKDPAQLLLEGRSQEIKETIFRAKLIIPKHLVTVSDILKETLQQPQYGLDFPWPSLTKMTYGLQMGEIHIITASTGIGKTEFVKELIFHFLDKGINIGLFSFEQAPANSLRRLVGAKLGIKLHLPGKEWDAKLIEEEAMKFDNRMFFYDKAGKVDLTDLLNSIRYWAKASGVKLFILDNLKSLNLISAEEATDFMNALKSLIKELNVTIFMLSHVAKDKYNYNAYVSTSPKNPTAYDAMTAEDVEERVKKPGMDWESGRMPTVANVEGGGSITALADYVFALARNTESKDHVEKRTMRIKSLKTRLDSGETGKTFKLYYTDRGTLEETIIEEQF